MKQMLMNGHLTKAQLSHSGTSSGLFQENQFERASDVLSLLEILQAVRANWTACAGAENTTSTRLMWIYTRQPHLSVT